MTLIKQGLKRMVTWLPVATGNSQMALHFKLSVTRLALGGMEAVSLNEVNMPLSAAAQNSSIKILFIQHSGAKITKVTQSQQTSVVCHPQTLIFSYPTALVMKLALPCAILSHKPSFVYSVAHSYSLDWWDTVHLSDHVLPFLVDKLCISVSEVFM
jgi:hypothetical protein